MCLREVPRRKEVYRNQPAQRARAYVGRKRSYTSMTPIARSCLIETLQWNICFGEQRDKMHHHTSEAASSRTTSAPWRFCEEHET